MGGFYSWSLLPQHPPIKRLVKEFEESSFYKIYVVAGRNEPKLMMDDSVLLRSSSFSRTNAIRCTYSSFYCFVERRSVLLDILREHV